MKFLRLAHIFQFTTNNVNVDHRLAKAMCCTDSDTYCLIYNVLTEHIDELAPVWEEWCFSSDIAFTSLEAVLIDLLRLISCTRPAMPPEKGGRSLAMCACNLQISHQLGIACCDMSIECSFRLMDLLRNDVAAAPASSVVHHRRTGRQVPVAW